MSHDNFSTRCSKSNQILKGTAQISPSQVAMNLSPPDTLSGPVITRDVLFAVDLRDHGVEKTEEQFWEAMEHIVLIAATWFNQHKEAYLEEQANRPRVQQIIKDAKDKL